MSYKLSHLYCIFIQYILWENHFISIFFYKNLEILKTPYFSFLFKSNVEYILKFVISFEKYLISDSFETLEVGMLSNQTLDNFDLWTLPYCPTIDQPLRGYFFKSIYNHKCQFVYDKTHFFHFQLQLIIFKFIFKSLFIFPNIIKKEEDNSTL